MDEGKISLLTLLDLSAAFDTLDIPILLSRLEHSFGISEVALTLLRSFLTDRVQSVCVNGSLSKASLLKFGVPQGSVLGPILFSLYVSPVSKLINAYSLSHQCYADDTQIYSSCDISQVDDLISEIQNCIRDLKQWMVHNKLHLNEHKTQFLWLIPKRFSKSDSLPHSIPLNGSEIPVSSFARNLGVYLDNNLSLDKQVSSICKAAYLHLRRISCIRQHLTNEAANTLVCAFVLSRLDYCNSLLSSLPQYQLDRLQKIQNHAARLVLRVPKRQSATPLLHQLHWLPIRKRIHYKLSCLCFSSLNCMAPSYLTNLFKLYIPSRDLRSSNQLQVLLPSFRLRTCGERSFSFQAAKSWNDLPPSLRHCSSHSAFKSSLKTFLFTQP